MKMRKVESTHKLLFTTPAKSHCFAPWDYKKLHKRMNEARGSGGENQYSYMVFPAREGRGPSELFIELSSIPSLWRGVTSNYSDNLQVDTNNISKVLDEAINGAFVWDASKGEQENQKRLREHFSRYWMPARKVLDTLVSKPGKDAGFFITKYEDGSIVIKEMPVINLSFVMLFAIPQVCTVWKCINFGLSLIGFWSLLTFIVNLLD